MEKLKVLNKILTCVIILLSIGGGIAGWIDRTKNKISSHEPYGPYEEFLKRPLDFILSGLALIVLSPVMLFVTLVVRIKLGSPVLFSQDRPGLNGRIFKLYKFRSMTNTRDESGGLLPDEVRLTKLGKLLRSTSIDELPELWNIVKGEMSIVGPRPLISEYLHYYTAEESHRHDVKPGLTGLAQVNGRSFISWEEIFGYDVDYIKNITFWGDVKIILNTVKKVSKRNDIADVSEAWKDQNGRYHCIVDGEEVILHDPMNIERERANAQGNR